MTEQDILDMLDSDELPKLEEEEKPSPKPSTYSNERQDDRKSFNSNRESPWDSKNIKPKKVDISAFNKTGRSFAIYYNGENNCIPDKDMEDKLIKIATALVKKEFTFRHNHSENDSTINKVLAIPDIKIDSYLPWGSFNKNMIRPKMKRANWSGYSAAMGIRNKYLDLPPTVRAIIAAECNTILGEKITDPVDLILVYCKGGYESKGKDVDYKKIGNLGTIFDIAKEAMIPVFNIEQEDVVDRLKEFILSITDKKNIG